ncbi:hypothetical protein EVAR_89725_1 [Eumeta japonica]|uniref:Uncharacterized protein n=1 Tax=Eumeta variegata TaxID=151549 RepID=A0A4C1Y2G6_EUMVA|nr:hypothetical protein EVAR_89725_1 [Eumeta japonica]
MLGQTTPTLRLCNVSLVVLSPGRHINAQHLDVAKALYASITIKQKKSMNISNQTANTPGDFGDSLPSFGEPADDAGDDPLEPLAGETEDSDVWDPRRAGERSPTFEPTRRGDPDAERLRADLD